MSNIKKLFKILSDHEQKRAFFVTLFILVSGLLDVLGIASIIPLVALLTNPDIIESNLLFNKVYKFFNFNNAQLFLFYAGLSYFIFFIVAMLIKTFSIYLQLNFSLMCEHTIGKRLLKNYLNKPYIWFLNHHSSDLAKNILSSVNQIIYQALIPIFTIISQGIIVILIILLLVFIDPMLTLIIGSTLSIIYGIVYLIFSNQLSRKGLERTKNDTKRYTALSNALSSIKETKIGKLEKFFVKDFSKFAKNFAKNQTDALVISQLPRHLFEAIAFGGLLLIILYLMRERSDFSSILPILSLYVFAGYRLMPALQQIYAAFTSFRFAGASINAVYDDKKQLELNSENYKKSKLDFTKDFSLEDIVYQYPQSSKTNIKNISIKIPVNTITGIIGPTGSGKTTLVDIITGLIKPKSGILKVDTKNINEDNLALWQNKIGYVPQQIFLIDDTLSCNIAFGVEPELIDHSAVEHVSKIANLHNFVIDELPEKYDTVIGERGIRLSGGQRQRIGIARALYNNPSVLIFDEATNSLDNVTEKVIIEALSKLKSKITIIIISHRMKTIENCNQIFLLDHGKIIAKGSYDELSKNSLDFNKFILKNN